MRNKRKQEKQQRKEAAREARLKAVSKVISIVYSLAVLCFMGLLLWLNVMPAKYLYPLIAILFVISLFIVPVMFSRRGKPGRRKGAMVVAVVLIAVFGVGSYYLGVTLNFFSSITGVGGAREDFYLVTQATASYEEAADLSGQTVGVHASAEATYAEARNQLKEEVTVEYEYVDELPELMSSLRLGEREAIFISAASYESMKGQDTTLETATKVIHTVSIRVESQSTTEHVNVTKEPFNILVSGLDTTGDISMVSRSDVNMLVTVNPNTNRVLLTSMPRDYYVTLAGKGAQDKLTHSGIYGINETVATVENFLGVNINYYVKVNYSTVTKLVDAMGGIEVNSPMTFTTHNLNPNYTFVEGLNTLDGAQALAYCRERYSFADGDIQRNKNQQTVLKAIIEKATRSETILSQYASILNGIKDNVETDMEQSAITSLIKMQLADMPSWEISQQSITGEYAQGQYCYALGSYADVVLIDEASVAQAVEKIMQVLSAEEGK